MSAYAQCDNCSQQLPCVQMEPIGWTRYVCRGCLSRPSRLTLLEAVLEAARKNIDARDRIEHQEQLVRDGNLHPSARTTSHIVSWMNAEAEMREAILAANAQTKETR